MVERLSCLLNKDPKIPAANNRINLFSETSAEERSSILSQASFDEAQSVFSPENLSEKLSEQNTLANLQALYRITEETVSPSRSQEQILQVVLDELLQAVGADRGCILLKNTTTEELEAIAVVTLDENSPLIKFPSPEPLLTLFKKSKRGVRTSDAQQDQRFSSGQSILREGDSRSNLCSHAGKVRASRRDLR